MKVHAYMRAKPGGKNKKVQRSRRYENTLRSSTALVFAVLILFCSAPLFIHCAVAQGGTWARGGMQIEYSISGVIVTNSSSSGQQLEGGGSVTTLSLIGTVKAGATITVSGTFIADNTAYSDNAGSVTIRAGSLTNTTGSISVPPSTSAPFTLSLTVPADAQGADISIGQGSNSASWGFGVDGSFTVQHVDHITFSDMPSPPNVNANSSAFEFTVTVWGPNNYQVANNTQVTFTLTDHLGGTLGDASIDPNPAFTQNSAVKATFTPPGDSYWADSLHSSFMGANYITITATAEDKQATYDIFIINPANTTSPTPTLLNTQVTLNANTPSKSYYYSLTSGQTISINFGVSGDPANLYIFDSLGSQVFSEMGINTDPKYQWTAPYNDTFQFTIETTGTQSAVTLTLEAANSQANENSYLPIAIAAVIVVVIVVVAVLVLVRNGKNRSKVSQLQETAPPPPPPPNLNLCPTCGAPLRWIPEYQRLYCDRKQKYP